ncbi:uncharacterized protein [Rutidosis leptorrhynchoides]|uniref:uncharacterized protein isoform X1 n=1 Tax=Rutidosis leptorrhynchoides TaxID=125765 RepID=UPI003A9A0A19
MFLIEAELQHQECAHRARPVTRANFKDSVSTSGLDPKVHYTLDARSHDNDLYTALKPAINPIQLLIIYLLMRYACKNIDPILCMFFSALILNLISIMVVGS